MADKSVIFDFDRTLLDGDSDIWVVTEMGLTQLFNELRSTQKFSWTSLMDSMAEELHLQGKTTEDIAQCLRQIPLHPQIISAIKSAHAMGCALWVVSDANQFYIETILQHHGLMGCFKEIVTNPTFIDKDGRLRIYPYHDFTSSSHGCSLCPSNMCKGVIIERIQAYAAKNGKKTFIYLGDGGADYCPCLKLGKEDHVMPRKNYPLWERIHKDPKLVEAKVHEWNDGEELARILLHLINSDYTRESNINTINMVLD